MSGVRRQRGEFGGSVDGCRTHALPQSLNRRISHAASLPVTVKAAHLLNQSVTVAVSGVFRKSRGRRVGGISGE